MRRHQLLPLLILALTLALAGPAAAEDDLALSVPSAILIEAETGRVLYAKNIDQPLPPASMTKMMTEYLVLEAIAQGQINWDDTVTVSANAAGLSGSEVWLYPGEERTVEELYTAMAVYSANDATVALAETVAGSETEFVRLMNQKAAEFGMKSSHFVNSSGFPPGQQPNPPAIDGDHVMTARDTALLARRLIFDHPEVLKYSSIAKKTFREGEEGAVAMDNWNWMLPELVFGYEGMDGLKTGETSAAGACFTGTAQRDGMRLISVVFGAADRESRFAQTQKLLDYGFNNFELKEFIAPGQKVPGYETVKVEKAKQEQTPVVTAAALKLPIKHGDPADYTYAVSLKPGLEAPLEKGAPVGVVTLKSEEPLEFIAFDQIPGGVELVTAQEVPRAGSVTLFFRSIGGFFSNLFASFLNLVTGS